MASFAFRSAIPICLLALLGIALSSVVASAQRLTFIPGQAPAEQVAPNAVYGGVRFKLDLRRNGKPTDESKFVGLLESVGGLMSKDGQYTLAVELLNGSGDEVLARRAIVTAQRKESGWFIFNRKSVDTQATEWYGDFPTSILVQNSTNNIRVRVRTYYSEQSKFDMETFNLLVGLVGQAKTLGIANTALDAAWAPIAQHVEGLLSSYTQSDITDVATLSFTRLGSTPYPASGVFKRSYAVDVDGNQVRYSISLTVETTQSPARVAIVKDGKISGPVSYGDVLAAARVADQPIDLVLATSKTEAVKKLLADLNSSIGYKGEDIGEHCDRAYDELSRYFTVTDKVISYWALLHLYRRKIADNPNGRDCLTSQVRSQMVSLGLPLDDLAFAREGAAVASRSRGLEPPAATFRDMTVKPAIEKIVPSNDVVDKLLGATGTSKTYQVYPLRKVSEQDSDGTSLKATTCRQRQEAARALRAGGCQAFDGYSSCRHTCGSDQGAACEQHCRYCQTMTDELNATDCN